jgi:hypothetical protein
MQFSDFLAQRDYYRHRSVLQQLNGSSRRSRRTARGNQTLGLVGPVSYDLNDSLLTRYGSQILALSLSRQRHTPSTLAILREKRAASHGSRL